MDVDEDSVTGLIVFLQVLDSLSIHRTMLDPLQNIQPTEYDVALQIMAAVIRSPIFAGTTISTRIAETVNTYTAAGKRSMYPNSQHHPVAFKIDIRFVHICRHTSKMIDIAAAEAAADGSSDNKTTDDNAKLLREGKDILDNLLNISLEQHAADTMVGIVIQIDAVSKVQLRRFILTKMGSMLLCPANASSILGR